MRNVKALTQRFEDANHPAAELGAALLKLTNNPDFAVSSLTAYLAAATMDRESERGQIQFLAKIMADSGINGGE